MLEGVKSPHPIEVVWEGEKKFRGGLPNGPTLLLDGSRQLAPSPVDSLLVALAACSGVDVVEILEKRRTPAESFSVHIEFSRAPTPPRRLTEVQLFFKVVTASEKHHVVRAVELSVEKYCSVTASLAPDIVLTWFVEVIPPASKEVAG
jgi:putative redox protein